MTLDEALKHGTRKISRRDAMLLLAHVTELPESQILIHGDKILTELQCKMFLTGVEKCVHKEPLQYIIGKWDFMGLAFKVDARALIPRPETELLVEEALTFISRRKRETPASVLDICTGSGCIALSIACLTDANVTATDISRDALSLAKENAVKLNANRVKFFESDLGEALLNRGAEKFDVIISNPPYIPVKDIQRLSETVRDFEPHLALDGGEDGMDIYRRLIPQSVELLKPDGALFLEIGPAKVADLAVDAGFKNVKIIRDYAGLERIVKGEF